MLSAIMGAALISTLWFMFLFIYNTIILSLVIVFHQPIILLVNYAIILVLLHLAGFKTLSYWLGNVEITDFFYFWV